MICAKTHTYKIDFSGQKCCYAADAEDFSEPRDTYRAGEKVVLYYIAVATDTSYTFLLDGENLNPSYSHERGYCIEFVMPDHDVKLQCMSRNTMLLEMPSELERDE